MTIAFFADLVSALIYIVCILFVISAMDDLTTDILFIFFKLVEKDDWEIKKEELYEKPEQRIALFVPAWQESEVITDMVTHNLANIDYREYDFFVGVYPNDKETLKKVTRLERKFPRVYKSVVPHDGPTCKADCLNWIYQRMKVAEENEQKNYKVIIMHDAEDIIHPLSFKLVNYLAPQYQMIQVPVFSLEVPWNYFTAGTYCDEFCEHHLKNLAVRQRVKGFIPSAGVGTAFTRDALDSIAKEEKNMIFNTDSLTEDYEIGLKFSQFKFKQILARKALKVKRDYKIFSLLPKIFRDVFGWRYQFIATREYFPNHVKSAVKQKSRWILGIIFQGWEQIKWHASAINRVFLYVDRKGIYSNIASFLANLLFLFGLLYIAAYYIFGLRHGLERFFPPSGPVWYLIIFNTLVMFERLSIKFYTSATIYGIRFAFLALLRVPWLNFVNFMAMCRAIYKYLYHKATRTRMTWDKTAHAFPSRDVMRVYRRRLGELLLENRVISQAELQKALSLQQKEGLRLGEILIRQNLISEEALIKILSNQYHLEHLERVTFDASLIDRLPADILSLYEAIPINLENGILTLGIREPLEQDTIENIEFLTGYKVQQTIISNYDFYRLKEKIKLPVKLGMRLVLKGILTAEQALDALAEQRESRLPLGDILVKDGFVSRETLSNEIKDMFGIEILKQPELYTQVEAVQTGDGTGYVLQDDRGRKVFVFIKPPGPRLVETLAKKYKNIRFKLFLLKDEERWKKNSL
jgi:adsorption protein B